MGNVLNANAHIRMIQGLHRVAYRLYVIHVPKIRLANRDMRIRHSIAVGPAMRNAMRNVRYVRLEHTDLMDTVVSLVRMAKHHIRVQHRLINALLIRAVAMTMNMSNRVYVYRMLWNVRHRMRTLPRGLGTHQSELMVHVLSKVVSKGIISWPIHVC